MADFTVRKGHHYHDLFPISTLPWIGEQSMSRLVTFHEDYPYQVPDYNKYDVNKLFGLSFGFGGVHHNSARFGHRWNPDKDCVELLAYCYINGKRNWDEQLRFPVVAEVMLEQSVYCFIDNRVAHFNFAVGDMDKKQLGATYVYHDNANLPHYGLTHGLYMGGDLPAQHDTTITINRL